MRWTVFVACTVAVSTLVLGTLVAAAAAPADAQSENAPANQSEELTQLVRDVRAHEALYGNLETTIERTIGSADEKPESPSKYFRRESRRTVRQNGLIRFEGEVTRVRPSGDLVTEKRLSFYDGKRTVSIEQGNSVNIHGGRYRPSMPSGSLPSGTFCASKPSVSFTTRTK